MNSIRREVFRNQSSSTKKSYQNLDRFIPNRSAMYFDFARYKLFYEGRTDKEIPAEKAVYLEKLREAFDFNRPRILEYKNKPPAPVVLFPQDNYVVQKPKLVKRYIPQTSERMLDCPGFLDDYNLNLLDWSYNNVLAVALENTVYLWDASTKSTSELVTVDNDAGPVTSVNWSLEGRFIAIGLNNSEVQLWDPAANRQLRTLTGGHRGRVGSLAWNDCILTTGSVDARIINSNLRIRDHIVRTYQGHSEEVCGLKWSSLGLKLASGGTDSLLHIWDLRTCNEWLHKLEDHRDAVKALAWCPFQANLLASGGGAGDGTIKFWNIDNGSCLNSVDTRSQVSALLWSTNERELLSSNGSDLTLWKYPSMVKKIELTGHTSEVISMSQSPDGRRVASVAGDETLKIWDVFGAPQTAKSSRKLTPEPFGDWNQAHIR